MTKIEPVINPETGAAVYPHFDAEGEAITPERIAEAESRIPSLADARPSYGAAEVAGSLRDALLAMVDATGMEGGPIPVPFEMGAEASISDVSTEEIDVCGHMADFEVQMSDGRTFRLRVSETFRR